MVKSSLNTSAHPLSSAPDHVKELGGAVVTNRKGKGMNPEKKSIPLMVIKILAGKINKALSSVNDSI